MAISSDSGIEIAVMIVERTEMQEDQDDQDGENQAEPALDGQVVDGLLDRRGLVEDDLDIDAF